MLLKIVYLLTCRVPGLAVLVFRGDRAKDAGLLVLGHENAVLRRHAGRIRYEPGGRVWFAALARLLARRRRGCIFPVTPAALLAWHRTLAGRKYGTCKRRKPGRPPAVPGIALLAVRLATENPLQGHRRIHGRVPLENRIQLVTCGSPGSGGARVFVDQAAQDGFPADPFSVGAGCPAGFPGSVQAQPAEPGGVAGRGVQHAPA